jgi:endonuclease/exonuclease/phosphatase family metal-dependent hydrolase
MKPLVGLILCIFSVCSLGQAETSMDLSVGSFNLHYISERRPVLPWDDRKDAVLAALNELDADIIGFQEVETWRGRGEQGENIQLQWLSENAAQYSAGAVGDPAIYPDTQPIFYRREKFALLQQGFFYFSDTPDQIYSRPWDQSFPQFASWVQLLNISTGKSIRVVNVHFDHSSKINRHGAAELVSERIGPWMDSSEPVIVLGDFNAVSWFKTIDILEDAGLTLADRDGPTFHFKRGLNLFPAIDHVLFSGFHQEGETIRLNKRYEGVWPSDHHPIKVSLRSPQLFDQSSLASDGDCAILNESSASLC